MQLGVEVIKFYVAKKGRITKNLSWALGGGAYPKGGGVLPYMGYMGMCRCEGYGFQAVYSRIGYINQSV